MKKIFYIVLFALIVLLVPRISSAAQIIESKDQATVINDHIEDNLIVIGNDVSVNGKVDGDLVIIAPKILITGEISGNLIALSQDLKINSTISNDAVIYSDILSFDKAVVIKGSLYAALNTFNGEKSQVNKQTYLQLGGKPGSYTYYSRLISALSMYILGILMISYLPNLFNNFKKNALTNYGKSLLIGLATIIIIPLASAVLIVSQIGLPIGMILVALMILAIYISTIIVGYIIGNTLFGKTNSYLAFAFGLIIIKFFQSTNTIGPFITFISVIYGLGIIMLTKIEIYNKIKKLI